MIALRDFTPSEHETWRLLFERQARKRDEQIWSVFSDGIHALGFTADRIPALDQVNTRLQSITGFKSIPVKGLESAESFFQMLADREFPIGYFIRDRQDLGYTPAPDVFHDLYGHVPFLTNPAFADFTQDFGARAIRYRTQPEKLRQWERLYWFTAEFALVKTQQGNRVFGAGIASSLNECAYSLGPEPEIIPFNAEKIRHLDYKIDEMQKRIFLLDSPEQLYQSLATFEERMERKCTGNCANKGNGQSPCMS